VTRQNRPGRAGLRWAGPGRAGPGGSEKPAAAFVVSARRRGGGWCGPLRRQELGAPLGGARPAKARVGWVSLLQLRQRNVGSPHQLRGVSACQPEQVPVPVYHPTPSQTRLATQLTEEEQIRIAQRIGLIQHLPKGVYDPGRDGSEKKIRECVICMMDFVYGDPIRFLPCMHIYHLDCIDDWLMRSFTCPSCMEPVDAALLSSYETN
uniref:RING finger protein 11 n=1 Tax=Crocodylus porosus TaxID=8502 RepID=A0A7M4FPW6_CROPO